MLEGLRTAAAGMLPRTTKQEIIANNIANVNTTGFKRDRVVFRRTLAAELAAAAEEGNQVVAEDVLTDFSQGPLEKTDRPLDVALDGPGFFVVQTQAGERYTRAGNFRLAPDGTLVTPDGNPVLGERGPIVLQDDRVEIHSDGDIYQAGELVGRLRIVAFDDLSSLRKEGHGLFVLTDPSVRPREAEGSTVRQGYLEGSNVNPLEEMVEMMVLLRNFEAEQKAIQVQDQTLARAVSDVPRF